MLAVGCQKEETKTETAPQAEQVQAETGKAVHFKTDDDKETYAKKK